MPILDAVAMRWLREFDTLRLDVLAAAEAGKTDA